MLASIAQFVMSRLVVRGLAALAILGTLAGAGRAADEPADAPRPLVLFDGKTLDGWKKTDFYEAEKVDVRVDDGRIILPVGRPLSGVTTTRTDLPKTNYELTYEAMRLEGTDFFAAATFPVGESFLTLVNGGWGGHITGLSSLNGADASENETARGFTYKNDTWYRFRIRVTDQAVRCAIDDKPMIAVDIEGRLLGTRIEVRSNQPLGFATWESAGALRNVEIRALSPAEIAENRVDED